MLAQAATMFLFNTIILFSIQKDHIGVYDREHVKFGLAMIWANSFRMVTISRRLLWCTRSHILPKAEFKMSLNIYFSTFVFALDRLLIKLLINAFILGF